MDMSSCKRFLPKISYFLALLCEGYKLCVFNYLVSKSAVPHKGKNVGVYTTEPIFANLLMSVRARKIKPESIA
jgi:hypothetical protein